MPAKLDKCIEKVEKQSSKVNPWAICKTSLKGEEMTDDMLVYPKEFKIGMKEELEHKDVIGDDKEALKKIVLAHLKEDPHYYSKLNVKMKAYIDSPIHQTKFREKESEPKIPIPKLNKAEEERQSPIRRSMKNVPHEKDIIRNLKPLKAEEETSIIDYKPKTGTKLPKDPRTPKQEIDSLMHLTQKKAEEEEEELLDILGRGKPGMSTPADTHALNVYKDKLSTKLGHPPRPPILHQTAEEGIMDKIKSTVKDLTSSPKPESYKNPTPITKSFTRRIKQRAEEEETIPPQINVKKDPLKYHTMSKGLKLHVDEPQNIMATHGGPLHAHSGEKKLSTQLLEKAEEEIGKDKVEEKKNQTIVENFSKPKKAEEEMDKPAVFKAPEESK